MQRAESRAILESIYKYSRYVDQLYYRSYAGIQSLTGLLRNGLNGEGVKKKYDFIEAKLRSRINSYGHEGLNNGPEIYKENRNLFLTDLANRSLALVKLDDHVASQKLSDQQILQLRSERNLHLSEQPILAKKLTLTNKKSGLETEKTLYGYLYDIYYRISFEDLLCIQNGVPNLYRCTPSDIIGDSQLIPNSIKNLGLKHRSIIAHGNRALLTLKNNTSNNALDEYEKSLASYPGGKDRFNSLAQLLSSHTDEQLLEFEVRNRLANTFLQRALNELLSDLRKEVKNIQNRDFSHYAQMDEFRYSVLQSLATDCGENKMEFIHESLMQDYAIQQRNDQILEVAYYIALGASFFINPVGASCILALSAAQLTASAAKAYIDYSEARDFKSMTEIRFYTGINSYEDYALAKSQYRSALTLALLEVFIPAYGSKSFGAVSKTIKYLVKSPKASFRVLKVAGRFSKVLIRKLSNGKVLVQRISSEVASGINELKTLFHLAKGASRAEFLAAAKQSGVLLSLGKSVASGIAMVGIERYNRGPNFANQQGFAQTMLITTGADGTLAFFGLGNLDKVDRMISVGGTVFAVSVLGQSLAGVRDEVQISQRALGDGIFGMTYALYSLQLQDRAAKSILKLGNNGAIFRSGTYLSVFTLGSLINNYIYSKGAIHFFESESDHYNNAIWYK